MINHFEDIIYLFDAKVLIRSWARETYENPYFRVMVCVAHENSALRVINWNGGVNIRCVRHFALCLTRIFLLFPLLVKKSHMQAGYLAVGSLLESRPNGK